MYLQLLLLSCLGPGGKFWARTMVPVLGPRQWAHLRTLGQAAGLHTAYTPAAPRLDSGALSLVILRVLFANFGVTLTTAPVLFAESEH